MQEDLQKLPPGFPRGGVPQPPFPTLAPTMGQMHTLMPTQSLQPTQQLEYKVQSVVLDLVCGHQKAYGRHLYIHVEGLNINFTVFFLVKSDSPCLLLQEQSLLQPPTLQLLNGMGPLGRRASDGGANIQLHAQLLKRPRGPSPLVTSPVRIWISVCAFGLFSSHVNSRSSDWWTLCLSQHPIPAVAPVDEEGSDGEPDQEAVQR